MKSQADEKWMLYDRRSSSYRMRKCSEGKYEPDIVDENAYMALDEESKKKYIILNPSAEPFKLHQFTGLDHFLPSKESLELTVMPANMNFVRGFKNKRGGRFNGNFHSQQQNSGNYHHQGNNQRHDSYKGNQGHQNQQQMPHVSEIERESCFHGNEQQESQVFYQQQDQAAQTGYQEISYDEHGQGQVQIYQAMPQNQSWNNQMVSYVQQPAYHPVTVSYGAPLTYQQIMPYGNFSIPPPNTSQAPMTVENAQSEGDTMNIIRDGELSSTSVNWKPRESHDSNGQDLPLTDIPTLQFFFNLGVRYYFASGVQRQLESLPAQMDNLDLNDNAAGSNATEKQNENLKSEQPPVPTNTPVSTKQIGTNYGPPGNRGNYQNNFRRPFGPNRDNRDNRDNNGGGYRGNNWNSNSRKEIKFNSNVKNAHKLESKACGFAGGQSQMVLNSGGPPSLIATSSGNLNTEKHSPSNNATAPPPQYSPISPVVQDANAHLKQQQQSDNSGQIPVQQYYAPYQTQPYAHPQPQGYQMVYQMSEDGSSYMVPQPVQYRE